VVGKVAEDRDYTCNPRRVITRKIPPASPAPANASGAAGTPRGCGQRTSARLRFGAQWRMLILKSPKITAHPTLPFSREEVIRTLAAVETFGEPGSMNRRRMKALVLLLRHSGLRIGDAVTLSSERLDGDKLFLYTSKAGTPVYCPLPPFAVTALEAALAPNQRFYFWSGNGKVKTIITDWQAKLKTLFEGARIPSGHAHRFRDTIATELLLAGVPLERVSILLGHSSIRITERHYSPWVRARQEQLERDVRATWAVFSEPAKEGTYEVRGQTLRPN
jgi:integrase